MVFVLLFVLVEKLRWFDGLFELLVLGYWECCFVWFGDKVVLMEFGMLFLLIVIFS